MKHKFSKLILLIFAIQTIGVGYNNKEETIMFEKPVDSKVNYNVEFFTPPSELSKYANGIIKRPNRLFLYCYRK